MTDRSQRSHGDTAPPSDEPRPPEPTHAERARTLLARGGFSTLATLSRRQSGFPFASVVPYAADTEGRPIFLISSMAMHTQNLSADPRATLLVAERADEAGQLGAARLSVIGEARPVEGEGAEAAADAYLARHPQARQWAGFGDFAFYRLEVVDVYYVGGFGVMGWVRAEDFATAAPDPLADVAAGILQHMNDDHTESLVLLARTHAGIEANEVVMTAIDRLGFHVRCQTADGPRGARIALPEEARTADEVRRQLVAMVRAARGGAG